jgi:cytochrome c peroxidase
MRSVAVILIGCLQATGVCLAEKPLGLPPVPVPQENPLTPEKTALGEALFKDTRFSVDNTIACATCHVPGKVFSDGLRVARGLRGMEGTRNAPSLVNAVFYDTFFLDGRAASLEEQVLGPLTSPIEHGLENPKFILGVIREDEAYASRFHEAFGVAPQEITLDHFTQAITSFERTLVSGDSPFDRYFYGGDKTALSESAARGVEVFRMKGNCANCHEIAWKSATFTDNRFYNLGVGFERIEAALPDFIDAFWKAVDAKREFVDTIYTGTQRAELGRFNVTHRVSEIGQFKTPSLRNVALTGPYMHDGSQKTLLEVVEYYDEGGRPNPFLDPAIFPLNLSEQEKKDLVAFMESLTTPEYAHLVAARSD